MWVQLANQKKTISTWNRVQWWPSCKCGYCGLLSGKKTSLYLQNWSVTHTNALIIGLASLRLPERSLLFQDAILGGSLLPRKWSCPGDKRCSILLQAAQNSSVDADTSAFSHPGGVGEPGILGQQCLVSAFK